MEFISCFSALVQGYSYDWQDWHMGSHMWGWGWGIMMFFMMLFWIIAFIGAIFFVRWLILQSRAHKNITAMDILKSRYARGEISKEEFEEKKKDLL